MSYYQIINYENHFRYNMNSRRAFLYWVIWPIMIKWAGFDR